MAPSIEVTFCLALLSMLFIINGTVAKGTIYNGQSINTNEFLENGLYRFVMQSDCNLVLYKKSNNEDVALWSSRTDGKGNACMAIFHNSGNLVILSDSSVVGMSNSNRGPNSYRLFVQGDGNVVIYGDALWATHTAQLASVRFELV